LEEEMNRKIVEYNSEMFKLFFLLSKIVYFYREVSIRILLNFLIFYKNREKSKKRHDVIMKRRIVILQICLSPMRSRPMVNRTETLSTWTFTMNRYAVIACDGS